MSRRGYPSDVSNEEGSLLAPYLTLMTEDAPQRSYPLREVFNGLRYIVRAGAPWRMMPNDLPPWQVVYQQARRWIDAGVFEALVHDLRVILRLADGRDGEPTAAILDSRTMQCSRPAGWRDIKPDSHAITNPMSDYAQLTCRRTANAPKQHNPLAAYARCGSPSA